jgi:hypothetical protein
MDDDIIVTLKRSNDLLMTFGNDYSDVFLPAIDEIERLREENKMYWTRYWDMAQAFERRGNALHRIASMRSDPEFGVPPIMTVQKIAQEALLKEKE